MSRLFVAAVLAALAFMPINAQAQSQAPSTGEAPSLRLVLVRVFTTDLDRSEHFYRDVFGLTQTQNYGEHERVMSLPGPGAPRLVLAHTDEPRGNGSFALAVTDIDGVMARAAAAGGTVTRAAAPAANLGVRIGLFTDPDGTLVEVIQPPAGQ